MQENQAKNPAALRARDESGRPPAFVHSWWRTSSTYVWSKLRELRHLCCYSEPLHEVVGGLTLPMCRGQVDHAIVAKLHHPPMQRPYFAEYEPLVRTGGAGFHKELSYDRYLLYPHETDAELEQYLQRLIGSARQLGKQPLLACVRSSLRAGWMKRRFGGTHIALLRNPRDQWMSMLQQHGEGGSYFVAGIIAIASKLRTRIPAAFAHVPVKLVDYRGPNYNPVELGRYIAMSREMGLEDVYALFMVIWLASTLQILSVSGIVIDCDRLSASRDLCLKVEGQLAAEGMPVDFSDFATPRYSDLSFAADRMRAIEADAVRALADKARPLVIYHPDRVKAHLDALDPLTARLMDDVLSGLLPAAGRPQATA